MHNPKPLPSASPMKVSRFLVLISSGLMSATLTQVGIAAEVKHTNPITSSTTTTTTTTTTTANKPTTTQPNTAQKPGSKSMPNAWNWGGYLQKIQRSIPKGTPDAQIIDTVMNDIRDDKAREAREYLMSEFKANKDHTGLVSFLIGFLYTEAIGGTKNTVEGFNFMFKSAQKGFVEGEYQLGRYYASGIGTPVDTLQAVLWYKVASEAGHEDATVNLKYLFIMEVVPDEWLNECTATNEAALRSKLIRAREFYRGYTDSAGNKINPDIKQALDALNGVVPKCVNPPQEQS